MIHTMNSFSKVNFRENPIATFFCFCFLNEIGNIGEQCALCNYFFIDCHERAKILFYKTFPQQLRIMCEEISQIRASYGHAFSVVYLTTIWQHHKISVVKMLIWDLSVSESFFFFKINEKV